MEDRRLVTRSVHTYSVVVLPLGQIVSIKEEEVISGRVSKQFTLSPTALFSSIKKLLQGCQ